jgi:D-3-phosphoglycerate dehydrogenase
VRTGAGYEQIDVAGLRAHGVEVARAAGRNVESVAEFVFAGLLALIRRVRESDTAVRSGDFAFRDRVVAGELHGRTLGILGFGPIGARVAEIGGAGFGMPVLVYHPWRNRPLPAGMTAVDDLDEFLTRSDVVSIHCRLSLESRGMIGAAQLELLGPGGHLVNTARGEIVDSAALAHALAAGRIAGAVLDVFPTEPLDPDSPLVTAPNLLLSPHLAGHTAEGVAGNGAWAAAVATDYLHHGRRPPEWSLCP